MTATDHIPARLPRPGSQKAAGGPEPAIAAGGGVGVPVSLGPTGGNLTYRQARQSPCSSCVSSPCCTHLLLATIPLGTLMEVDHAAYLLNFEGIVLALGNGGTSAQVYLHQPCTFLDVPSGLCTVHSTPVQPAVCVKYNAHACGYREAFATDLHHEHPLLDPRRMEWLAEQLAFDDERRVVGHPEWDEVLRAFSEMPTEQVPLPAPEAPDPILAEWQSVVLSDPGPEAWNRPWRRYSDAEVSRPCEGCEAWCCQRLVFNRGKPTNTSQLEFLRYCLGFPGVELGVGEDTWSVVVHSRCRHLEGTRCSVYGTEQRPLKCGYFDAHSCAYRGQFGTPRPDDLVRLDRDRFQDVARSISFDGVGNILAIPSLEQLRERVEDGLRASAQRPLNPIRTDQ